MVTAALDDAIDEAENFKVLQMRSADSIVVGSGRGRKRLKAAQKIRAWEEKTEN